LRWKFYGNQNVESWSTTDPQKINKANWSYNASSNQITINTKVYKILDIGLSVLDIETIGGDGNPTRVIWSPE
jgi:hypothetical protein